MVERDCCGSVGATLSSGGGAWVRPHTAVGAGGGELRARGLDADTADYGSRSFQRMGGTANRVGREHIDTG